MSALLERRKITAIEQVNALPVEGKGQNAWNGRQKPRPPANNKYIGVAILAFLYIFIFTTVNDLHAFKFEAQANNKGMCDGFDGVLHIAQGDVEGAAGTIFFLFVLNQIIYAEKHNLMPWVHLNNVSHYVYDPYVHGMGPPISFKMMKGINASWVGIIDPISQQQIAFPGRPTQKSHLSPQNVTVFGNGVWNSYFQPVSPFVPGKHDSSCEKLPLIRLGHTQIIPALHVNAPWALRAWRYGGLPPGLRQDELSYDEWFAPMRKRGNAVVRKYVRFLPHMHQLADQANPSSVCLGLHIRHSDKANRRQRIPVKKFLPYVQAYVQAFGSNDRGERGDFSIFLATDSHKVIGRITTTWPSNLVKRIRWQDHTVRSNDTTPVFTLSSHHLTNTQVLVDILGLAKCEFLLHGLSAVSEAVHYLNIDLHRNNNSVNLEIPTHATVDEFRRSLASDMIHG